MFGECHAHVIMDGINYKAAVALHKDGVCEAAVRAHLKEWKDAGITFVRDGNGVSKGLLRCSHFFIAVNNIIHLLIEHFLPVLNSVKHSSTV